MIESFVALRDTVLVESKPPIRSSNEDRNGVKKALLKGIHVSRAAVCDSAFPATNTSGYWQAWLIPPDNYMVLPLDTEKKPCGLLHSVEKEIFYELFAIAPSEKTVNADAPDLFSLWLKEALDEGDAGVVSSLVEEVEREFRSTKADEGAGELVLIENKARIAGVCEEEPCAAGPSLDEVSAVPWASVLPVVQETEEKNTPAAEFSWDALVLHSKEAPIASNLRDRISLLLLEIMEKYTSDTVQSLAMLVYAEDSIRWDQPQVLTELGLALRREKQYELALLCHQQALVQSPADERVLFNIARAEFEQGNITLARKRLQEALAINPEFAVAAELLCFFDESRP